MFMYSLNLLWTMYIQSWNNARSHNPDSCKVCAQKGLCKANVDKFVRLNDLDYSMSASVGAQKALVPELS